MVASPDVFRLGLIMRLLGAIQKLKLARTAASIKLVEAVWF
jgi:hypothetical protein